MGFKNKEISQMRTTRAGIWVSARTRARRDKGVSYRMAYL